MCCPAQAALVNVQTQAEAELVGTSAGTVTWREYGRRLFDSNCVKRGQSLFLFLIALWATRSKLASQLRGIDQCTCASAIVPSAIQCTCAGSTHQNTQTVFILYYFIFRGGAEDAMKTHRTLFGVIFKI